MARLPKNPSTLGIFLLGCVLGAACSHVSQDVWAEVRRNEDRAPVPSGAQQSAAILSKMATTLDSIDARLGRLETSVNKIAARQPGK